MNDNNLIISKLEGYSGIRLKNNEPLVFRPGINLLVGRNGSGKTNLMRLIQVITTGQLDIKNRIESSFFKERLRSRAPKMGNTTVKSFGKATIVEHHFRGETGRVLLCLNQELGRPVLENILQGSTAISGFIDLVSQPTHANHRYVYGHQNLPRIEMSGYVMGHGLLSPEHGNQVHTAMIDPIQNVTEFINARLKEFYTSNEFQLRMEKLESAINEKFRRFLGTANKRISINYKDIPKTGRVEMLVMDKGNLIQSQDFSTGEATLFNLVLSLAAANEDGYDILSFDEPDTHMHDDMIQVLVDELAHLAISKPNCIMLVASHSTPLIEKLAALGKELVNIITFDSNREVRNSQSDLDLINALQRNGVAFSPLMLSKRLNIFIENKFQPEDEQRRLFVKLFPEDVEPNIVPIGFSGNVEDSDSFAGVIEEILRIKNIKSIGIQDGDIWFRPQSQKNYHQTKIPAFQATSHLRYSG